MKDGYDQMTCGVCGIVHYVPTPFMDERRKEGEKLSWFCPSGHERVFRKSEADKLREERDRLAQRIAQKDDEIKRQKDMREHAERQVAAAKGQVTKMKKRAAAGVCPCCNRTFQNLHRHMTTQHPTFKDEKQDADNVVPLKKA